MGIDVKLSDKNIKILLDCRKSPFKILFIDHENIENLDNYIISFILDTDFKSILILANLFMDCYELIQSKYVDHAKDMNYN
jgi:hypothetical protein